MAFDSSWKVLQFGFWLRLNRSKRSTVNSLKRFLSATHFAKSWDFPTERLTGSNCCNSEYRQFKNSEIDFSFICSRPEGAFSRHIVLFASRKLAATERKAKEKKIKVSGFGNVAEQGPWRIYSSGKARDPILSGGLRLGASESTASRPSIRSASNRPVHNETFISSLFVFCERRQKSDASAALSFCSYPILSELKMNSDDRNQVPVTGETFKDLWFEDLSNAENIC